MLYISPTLWMAGRLLVVSVQLEHMNQGMFSAVVVIMYYVCGSIFLLLSTAVVLLLLVAIDVFYYFIVDFVVLYFKYVFVAFVPGKVLSGLVVQNVLFI